jgi:hypothetical protein
LGQREVLLLFPNVFLFVAAQLHWRPRFAYTPRATTIALVVLTLAKLTQEFILHIAQWLDAFTAKDLVDAIIGPFGPFGPFGLAAYSAPRISHLHGSTGPPRIGFPSATRRSFSRNRGS